MRRRLWKQQRKKPLLPSTAKVVIERDTLRRIVGNHTLRSTPNISKRRKRKQC
jgi:hypothetical protein